jgi:hypothetical protein
MENRNKSCINKTFSLVSDAYTMFSDSYAGGLTPDDKNPRKEITSRKEYSRIEKARTLSAAGGLIFGGTYITSAVSFFYNAYHLVENASNVLINSCYLNSELINKTLEGVQHNGVNGLVAFITMMFTLRGLRKSSERWNIFDTKINDYEEHSGEKREF